MMLHIDSPYAETQNKVNSYCAFERFYEIAKKKCNETYYSG